MSASVSKSRSPVERSYSSASSTTSSRRSGPRKRRRMKHTVMPLKKRSGRHEVPCDVHRVSNLDHEEMEQSACFWVAKNIDDPSERSFKEDVFVNKDQDSSDDEMSYLEERRQSQTSGELTHEVRAETRNDAKYVNEGEKENNAKYANEDGERDDANYSEEKTFYGVRKGKMEDGNDLKRVSPIPSPRNRTRISSFSDDGHSGFSSEGTGMHVGWTSDVGVSSGPEYLGMTDESDGKGGHKETRRGSKEFYGYGKKSEEKSEFPTRKIREQNNNEGGAVMATDVTTTKTTEVENFEDNYESKNYSENQRQENVEIDREFYTKEEIESSRYSAYNGRDVVPGINPPREEFESPVSDPRHYEPSEQVSGRDFDPPINAQGEFEPRISDPRYYEPSEHVPDDKEGLLPGVKTSTPTARVHPSSDTELVNFRSFDIDVDRYSDRSLPLGGHKTKTQYYSVEDLIRSAKEETTNAEKADSGTDGPEVPRVGEYEKYEPPRDTHEEVPAIRGSHADDQEPQPNGINFETPRVIPSIYDVNTQRPLLVPRRDKVTGEHGKDDLSPRDGRPEVDEHSGTYDESKEFYGYRRTKVGNEDESENKENLSPQYDKEKDSDDQTKGEDMSPQYDKEKDSDDQTKDEDMSPQYGTGKDSDHQTKDEDMSPQYGTGNDSGRPTKDQPQDDYKSTGTSKVFDDQDQQREFPIDGGVQPDDDRTFKESKEFYGNRQSRSGAEPRDDVRQRYEDNKTSSDQSKNTKWQETKEFYGYRTSKTGSKENLLDEKERPPQWEQNQEFYGYRESKTGNEFASPQDEKHQTNGNTTKTRTFKESREFYGFRSFGSSENVSKGGRDGQIWEESKEFFGFQRKQVVDGQTHVAVSGRQERPRSPLQRRGDGKVLYLESADDKTREELLKESRDENTRDESQNKYDKNRPYDKRPYEKQPYEKQPTEKQPYDKRPYEKRPTEKQTPSEERPDERITKSKEQDNLMSVDDAQDFGNKSEESREFYGYRRPEELPRSAAYEQYQRPEPRSEKVPPARDGIPGDRITTRGYDVKSTRYTERQTRETNVTEYKSQTSEPEIKDSRMDDVYMQPDDAPEDPSGEYDHTRRYDPTRKFDPTRDRDPTGDMPREKHMFNILEIPSSKKVIPLVSDIAPKFETNQTTTTETTTKRLHTRSQRDTLRREARQPDPTEPESSDMGMKMFRQRSLPRKHGHPTSSDEKSKELPRKITKKSDEPDLSEVDPDFANKFREITEKRKKTAKTTTNTTETTTKSAAESCNKNVEELVNVFNTLEHIQKTADKKSDKSVQPGQVKKIVKGETLDKPSEKENNLSPATSISQKLHEIEDILDSVDKNRQRGTRKKPDDEDKPAQSSEGRDTRPWTQKTRETYTTRETRETREERETRETREKHAWKPRTSDDLITKQEEMSVESFLEDERGRPSRGEPVGQGESTRDQPRPVSYTDRSPYRRPRGYDKTRSRDDDDEIYRAQIRKSREKSWRDTRKSRKKKYDSKSDGEIEGFKSRPFGDKVITPGTAVNIRLYGLNLQKTNEDRAQDLNWELFTGSGVPVDESVGRTQLKKQPFEVEQFPETKMPVDESIDRTQVKKQPLDVEQMPGERTEEPTIDRSHVKPADVNFPPSFDQNDEPRMRDLSTHEQQEPFYRRQERLPRKRDAPIARSDSLDDDKVTSQEIKWSHPPVSKVRQEKEPSSKVPRDESPGEPHRAESPSTQEVMEVDSVTETNTETIRRDTKIKSVRKDTTEERNSRTTQPGTEAPSEEWPSEEKPLEEFPSKSYPSEDRPYEKRPYEKRPSDKRPYRKRPSEEIPEDIEIPIEKVQETEAQEEPDGLIIEIEYTDDDEDENKLAEQDDLPGQSTLYEKSTLRSSTPKLRSPRLSDDIFDGDSSHTSHEESTEKHESTSHESTNGVDTTIHTKKTTRTTRTETTSETTVKKVRKSGSDSSRIETLATGEPDFRVPARNEPEYSTPESSRPDNVRPARSQPEYSTPESDEPDFRVPVRNEPEVFTEPEYTTPVYSEPAPEYNTPVSGPQPDKPDEEPRDEPSLVATEFIIVNNDTGRPINLTMLGRLEENDDDYLSSQSREDLFLHTRLKMVTENKNKRTTRRPEDAHLLEPKTADQDDVDNEGSLTSSDEFDTEDVATVPEGDVTEQLLIPISGKIKENIDKQDKPRYVFPKEDGFTLQTQVDEAIFKTDQPTREDVTRDSFGNVFIPRIPHEPDLEREHAPTKTMPDFESIPGFKEPVSENVEFSEKPGVVLEFGEPVTNEEKDKLSDIEIVELPLFDDFSVESAPSEKIPIDEQFSKERTATPTLPELKHEPVDENITSQNQDKLLDIPDITETKPVQPLVEIIQRSTQTPRDLFSISDLEELSSEIRRPPTPTLVNETITSEQRQIEIELPHFTNTRPSQPIDEDIIQSEPIKKEVYVPDFQELIPETKKPVLPVDENVTSERRESKLDIPEFQIAETEGRASEPITEEISADEPIENEVYIPDFAVEFQEVLPEFPESAITNEDRDIPVTDEAKAKDVDLPDFQEEEQEPHRNVRITESDLEVEAPSSSSSQSSSTESEVSDKNDVAGPEDVYKAPEKVPHEKDTYEKDTFDDETWSETHKTVKETRTTETVIVEKTITKYASEVPQKKDEPVSPRSPKKEGPISPKAVRFASSIEPKDSGESSSEPSPRSSSGASADVSDRDKPEVPARKRRSRRGNRFDNLKRSGPLVPESVVRDESPVSNIPRVGSPVVPEREQPVSNIPDSGIPAFTPQQKTGQLRPEMYLLDSDNENQGGDLNTPDEGVVAELCVPEEREEIPEAESIPGEDESPARDELSPELIDELLEKEIRGLAEDDESLETSEGEPEVLEIISKEDKEQPELENMPEETVQVDETVLAEETLNKDDSPTEITEEIEKSLLNKDKPRLSDEEDGNLPQEEIEKAIENERSPTPHEEPEEIAEEISKSLDERVPKDAVLPEPAREEPLEAIVPDEEPEKSGGEDFEVILIEHLSKDDDVSDGDVREDEVIDKDDVSEKSDDVLPKDEVSDKEDDDVISKQGDFPGGVTTEEESTVETVIVEKTHSEVTVTEITTTRYPTSPQDTPPTTSEFSEDPQASPSDDEGDYVIIIPTDVAKSDEIVKPCEVETVEGMTYDDQPTTNDEQPTTHEDKSIPLLIITEEPKRQPTSDSDSDKESSDSESSTTESDDERTDSDINKVVATETMVEAPNQPTQTVFGIVDIYYEKPQNEEIVIVEKNPRKTSSDDDSEKDVLIVVLPENLPTNEDGPTHDDVPTVSDETPKEDTAPLELEIVVVPVDEESTTSSDEEPTNEDKRVPRGTSETTVETLIIEKTSTQMSTTITRITPSSDESQDSENDSEVPVTIVPEDDPTSEALPKPQEVSPEEKESPQLDIVVVPVDSESTTSSDSESTSDKDTEVDHIPEEQESPDINIAVVPADDESTTSSDKESTSDDEEEREEISTVETIIVEKTHSQVSTTITEITPNNAPNYPTNDPNYPTNVHNYPTSVEDVPTTEDIPKTEYTPTFTEYPIADDLPTAENVPKTEIPLYETAPILDECEGLVYEISPAGKTEETDGPSDDTDIQTNERQSQTENRDVHSETTQTDDTTETARKTRDAFSMTPTRLSNDSEIQTQIEQGSASTQTNDEEDSQWYRYTRTVEEVQESSDTVTNKNRQLFDSETQTDTPVDDDLRVLATTHEGTQTELDEHFSESEVTRITRKTTTETRSETSYKEETDTRPSRDDIKNDCPVCLQSLEATNYSFIKVQDLSRFVAMEEKYSQYEIEETSETSHSVCFACGRHGTTGEASGYSSTMREEQGERGSRRGDQGFSSTSMDITDGYSNTARGDLGFEGSRSGEGSEFSSTTMYESGQEMSTREGHGFSSTTRDEWSYERSTRETSEYSSTSQEWEQNVLIQSESSTEVPEGAHFSIHIDGDEKCLLYCRRSGKHTCALQKLASIIEAHRKAATSSNEGASAQAHSSEIDQNSEIVENVETVENLEEANEESGEHTEAGISDVIGPQRCDVSVQTDGALLPADFEVFSDKDFEIYYDEQKSPRWTAMTIAQGMQKEHESLVKQLDMLRDVNQKLRDQKDAIQAAHEAQSTSYMSLRDELAFAQTLESSPVKEHKVVTRQGSEMSKYFDTFEGNPAGMRQDSRLESVTETNEAPSSSTPVKRKLTRTKTSLESIQPPGSVSQDILEYASVADGAEFETERVFEDGELKEAERPEWMERVHQVTEPIMSEAEKQRTEQQFRKHKANMVPQLTAQNGQRQLPQASDEEDGVKEKIPLSPRTSPVGTETEVQTEHQQNNSLKPERASHIQRVYKVVFVGDSGVGKSSFIHRYCYEIWKPSYTATIGVDFQVKSVQLGLKKLALQLWDTAGQERFRSITKQYFRKADGVVLLYDLTSEASFINIKSWMTSVEEAAEPGCTVILVGNKLDLCEEDQKCRAVAYKTAEELAEEYGCLYAEASAKSGENVNEAMEILASRLQEQEDWQLHSVLNLKLDEGKKKRKCCGR